MEGLQCTYSKNSSGMFVWGKLPINEKESIEFTDKLLHNKGIFITPGDVFGKNGKGYVRASLCTNEETLIKVQNRLIMPNR